MKKSQALQLELEYQLRLIIDHEYLNQVLQQLVTMPTGALLLELDMTLSCMKDTIAKLLQVQGCGGGDET